MAVSSPMQAHVPTMFMMLIAVSGALAIAVGALARRGERDGLTLWAIGLGLHTLVYVLFSLRGQVSDLLSIVVANTLLSTAMALLNEAICRFQQRHPPRLLLWLPVPVVALLFLWFIEAQAVRTVLASVFISAQLLVGLTALWRQREQTVGRGQVLVGASFLLVIVTFVYRAVVVLLDMEQLRSLTEPHPIQTLSFMISMVSSVIMSLGFVIMSKERADERNRELAMRDALTGLRNRRALLDSLRQQIALARRGGLPLSLLAIDVDHFKQVNDRLGHLAGDRVLQQVAGVIGTHLRGQDIAGRFGGEEFLVVLPNTPRAGALKVAGSLREAVASAHLVAGDGQPVPVTISIGVHEFDPETDRDLDPLIHAADQALYRAKALGRDRVESSEPRVQTSA